MAKNNSGRSARGNDNGKVMLTGSTQQHDFKYYFGGVSPGDVLRVGYSIVLLTTKHPLNSTIEIGIDNILQILKVRSWNKKAREAFLRKLQLIW